MAFISVWPCAGRQTDSQRHQSGSSIQPDSYDQTENGVSRLLFATFRPNPSW